MTIPPERQWWEVLGLDGPIEEFTPEIRERILTRHGEICDSPFRQYHASSWMWCQRGHTYYQVDDQFWCRPFMEGYQA